MKICSKCKEEKPLSAFSKDRGRKDGHSHKCKGCHNEGQRIRYQKLTKGRPRGNEQHRKDPRIYRMLNRARERAKIRSLPFNITSADISIPTNCPVLGVPIKPIDGSVGPKDNSPSLDRIVPRLGYVKGNVCVISHRANVLKNNSTPEELRQVADWLERMLA